MSARKRNNKSKQPRQDRRGNGSRNESNRNRLSAFSSELRTTGIRVGFPANRTVKMNYVSDVTVTCTGGLINTHQWRLNSAFDPDYTSTGHQPLGFDQWSEFYNHYCVKHVEWEYQSSPTAAYPVVSGAYVSDDTTVPSSDIHKLTELGGSTRIQSHYPTPPVNRGSLSMKDFFNREGDIANDPDLRALISANPAEEAYLTFYAQPLDEASTLTMRVVMLLTYTVTFSEPKDLGVSARTSSPYGLRVTPRPQVPNSRVIFPTVNTPDQPYPIAGSGPPAPANSGDQAAAEGDEYELVQVLRRKPE